MARTLAEYALGRALAWLRWSGVPLDSDTTRLAMRIVEQALVEGDADLMRRVMVAMARRIERPALHLPPPGLPIHRASLGYAPYL